MQFRDKRSHLPRARLQLFSYPAQGLQCEIWMTSRELKLRTNEPAVPLSPDTRCRGAVGHLLQHPLRPLALASFNKDRSQKRTYLNLPVSRMNTAGNIESLFELRMRLIEIEQASAQSTLPCHTECKPLLMPDFFGYGRGGAIEIDRLLIVALQHVQLA